MRSPSFIQAMVVLLAQQKTDDHGAAKLTIVEKLSQVELR